ncbi:hypothetical protein [Chitinilyticum piscinae]|uniref:Uncharacterized protein n=1 Tax=Chitinilyticum piscinae TaxID=2866724 RepID=A0A8J7FZQ9_9NEIS|nr:hypothetical protein [Chitinilyticum piscinae]MBE9609320.1 hypothetical protein [Chitinilyticum piscinae]
MFAVEVILFRLTMFSFLIGVIYFLISYIAQHVSSKTTPRWLDVLGFGAIGVSILVMIANIYIDENNVDLTFTKVAGEDDKKIIEVNLNGYILNMQKKSPEFAQDLWSIRLEKGGYLQVRCVDHDKNAEGIQFSARANPEYTGIPYLKFSLGRSMNERFGFDQLAIPRFTDTALDDGYTRQAFQGELFDLFATMSQQCKEKTKGAWKRKVALDREIKRREISQKLEQVAIKSMQGLSQAHVQELITIEKKASQIFLGRCKNNRSGRSGDFWPVRDEARYPTLQFFDIQLRRHADQVIAHINIPDTKTIDAGQAEMELIKLVEDLDQVCQKL